MAKISIPDWLSKPEEVQIACLEVAAGMLPGELTVRFRSDGQEYTSFVPKSVVDQEKKLLRAKIVAEIGDSWLVDLPSETLTSGPRVRFLKSATELVH